MHVIRNWAWVQFSVLAFQDHNYITRQQRVTTLFEWRDQPMRLIDNKNAPLHRSAFLLPSSSENFIQSSTLQPISNISKSEPSVKDVKSRRTVLSTVGSATILAVVVTSKTSLAIAKDQSEVPMTDHRKAYLVPSSSSPVVVQVLGKEKRSLLPSSVQESISGFVAGAALSATKTVVKFPLDTATVRLQQANKANQVDLLGLFQNCYNGVIVTLLCNIPAGAVFFAVKDAVKSVLKNSDIILLPRWLATCVAVAVAQIPYWLVRNPSEVIKVRQQAGLYIQNGTDSMNAFEVVVQTLQNKNLPDLYTGYWENVLYAFPADVMKFVVYEMITRGQKDLSPLQGAEAGALATAVAQLVTTPLDVVRNRLMMKARDGQESSLTQDTYIGSLIRLGREEGSSGLFAGATPRVGKAILSGAIQFATYEETKQFILKLLSPHS